MANAIRAARLTLAAVLGMGPFAVVAMVSSEEAARLGIEGTELTPMGAIRAGNADGSIFGGCNYFETTDLDAYLYVPGQRRVRKASELGFYDSPSTNSDVISGRHAANGGFAAVGGTRRISQIFM